MKKFLKVKKIICFTLCIAMLFSFVACSKKAEAHGENLYISANGINTKKLVLKVSGVFPEGTTPVVSYIDDAFIENMKNNTGLDDLEITPIISVSEKSSKENYLEYVITGLSEGYDELKINFVKDEMSYSKITAKIFIDSKLKISSCSFNLIETSEQYILSGDVVTDNLDGVFLEFSLTNDGSDWITSSFDENVIQVFGPYFNEDNTTINWKVQGVSVGTGSLLIANEDTEKQIDIEFEVYKTSEEEDSSLFVRVLSSGESSYSLVYSMQDVDDANTKIVSEEITDANGNKSVITSAAAYIDNLYIPDYFLISDISTYEDSKSTPIMELVMKEGDEEFFVKAWGNTNLKSIKNDLIDKTIKKTLSEFTVGEINVEQYDVGVDLFFFEKDGVVYMITFGKGSETDSSKAIIEKYLN